MADSITPPPNLVRQWIDEPQYMTEDQLGKRMYMIFLNEVKFREIISKASQYGADQELKACCEWLQDPDLNVDTYKLRAARRPKPLSLKAQALALIDACNDPDNDYLDDTALDTIRRALESIDD